MKRITIPFIICLCLPVALLSQTRFLYGVSQMGGTANNGTLFAFNPLTGKDSVVFNFTVPTGVKPQATTPLKATNGLLYFTLNRGGANGDGTIMSFDPKTGKDSIVLNFSGANGAYPAGPLLQARNGLLYGMTYQGGSKGFGVMFSYDPVSGKDSTLFSFVTTNGQEPLGGLIQATDGLLYGLTQAGGAKGHGVLFSYNPVTGKDSTRISLIGTARNADGPYATLVQAPNGLLYGTSHNGGTVAHGTIFSYDPVTGVENSLIVDFTSGNGTYPNGTLFLAANGLLYGTTVLGGTNNDGVIFSFNPNNKAFNVLFSFNGTDGQAGDESFVQDSATGLLYGMTNQGGVNGKGVIYSFDTLSHTCTDLFDFDGTTYGDYPLGGLCFVSQSSSMGVVTINEQRSLPEIYPNPFNNYTVIRFNNTGKHYFELFDCTGKKIQSAAFTGKEYTLNREGLVSGMYFVKYFDTKHQYLGTSKIVVQ